jgi:hypothetical protein
VLEEEFPAYLVEEGCNPITLSKRNVGSFDFRAHLLSSFISSHINYKPSGRNDPWQFPEETLALRSGDCEDIAFLLASLLLSSGISAYNIRVAIGKVHVPDGPGIPKKFDHAWVMYKCELGTWLLLEPLFLDGHRASTARSTPQTHDNVVRNIESRQMAEYIPAFIFNVDHLWEITSQHQHSSFAATVTKRWSRIHPGFAGSVHRSIMHDALDGVAPRYVQDAISRHFSHIGLFGPIIEDIDNFTTHRYDSRDHFDNAFIPEAWSRVQTRLSNFSQNNHDFTSFANAAHGIADFYAHSTYLHFASVNGGAAANYNQEQPSAGLLHSPTYDKSHGIDLAGNTFSVNTTVYKGKRTDIPSQWEAKMISGRYAQLNDSKGVFEALTNIPDDLGRTPGFSLRGGLPHHNEIAVDDESFSDEHILYANKSSPDASDRTAYINQFRWRKQTAINHIRSEFLKNWHL